MTTDGDHRDGRRRHGRACVPAARGGAGIESAGAPVHVHRHSHRLRSQAGSGRGFPLEFIEIGGLKRVGVARNAPHPGSTPVQRLQGGRRCSLNTSRQRFSAWAATRRARWCWRRLWKRLPIVVMEPNAMPGLTNRHVGRFVTRALLNFPGSRAILSARQIGNHRPSGAPRILSRFRPKPREAKLTVLITGGSQGSRTLNEAARGSWSYFREAKFPVRFIHQTGAAASRSAGARNSPRAAWKARSCRLSTTCPQRFAEPIW